jgi:hypothetical protein
VEVYLTQGAFNGFLDGYKKTHTDDDLIDRAALAILQARCNDMGSGQYPFVWRDAVEFVKARAEVVGRE